MVENSKNTGDFPVMTKESGETRTFSQYQESESNIQHLDEKQQLHLNYMQNNMMKIMLDHMMPAIMGSMRDMIDSSMKNIMNTLHQSTSEVHLHFQQESIQQMEIRMNQLFTQQQHHLEEKINIQLKSLGVNKPKEDQNKSHNNSIKEATQIQQLVQKSIDEPSPNLIIASNLTIPNLTTSQQLHQPMHNYLEEQECDNQMYEEMKEENPVKALTMREIVEFASLDSHVPKPKKKENFLISSLTSVQFKTTLQDFLDTEVDASEDIIKEASQLIFEQKPYYMGIHASTISQERKVINSLRVTNVKDNLKAYLDQLTFEEKDKLGLNVLESPTLAYVLRPSFELWKVLKPLADDLDKFKNFICKLFGEDFLMVKPLLVNPNKIVDKGIFKQKVPLIYVEFDKNNESLKERFWCEPHSLKEVYDSNREIIARVSPFIRRDPKVVLQSSPKEIREEGWTTIGRNGKIVEKKVTSQVPLKQNMTFAQIVQEKNPQTPRQSDMMQLCELLRRQNDENKSHFALLYQALNIPFPSNLKLKIKATQSNLNEDQK